MGGKGRGEGLEGEVLTRRQTPQCHLTKQLRGGRRFLPLSVRMPLLLVVLLGASLDLFCPRCFKRRKDLGLILPIVRVLAPPLL